MKLAALVAEAMKLEPRTRAGVARQLLESLDDPSPDEIDALRIEEAERRDHAVDAGV